MKSKIKILEREKNKSINEVNKINIEIRELKKEISENIAYNKKSEIEKDNYIKEIKFLKEVNIQYKEDLDSLNSELEKYKREMKIMEKEIKSLNQKIIELNMIIEKLKSKVEVYESNKKEKIKNKNEVFCNIFKSFSMKKTISVKIYMIIGMYLYRHEKHMDKKYSKLKEKEKMLQKTVSDLTEEIYISKYIKKLDNKNEISIKKNSNVSRIGGENENRLQIFNKDTGIGFGAIQGKKSIVEVGTNTQQFGNNIITNKTTQISFRRKKLDNNQ